MLNRNTLIKMAQVVPVDCPECNITNCTYDVSLCEPCRKQFNIARRIIKLYRQSDSKLNICGYCKQPIFKNEYVVSGAGYVRYYHKHCHINLIP